MEPKVDNETVRELSAQRRISKMLEVPHATKSYARKINNNMLASNDNLLTNTTDLI